MARYGCLIISVIIALLILVVTVWFWSGWLNRPTGHAPAQAGRAPAALAAAPTTTAAPQPAVPSPINRHPAATGGSVSNRVA